MDQVVWMVGSGREMTADLDGLRAVVSRPCEDGAARFVVLRPCGGGGRPALVQSGHRRSVRQAMRAAEQTAERLATLP